MTLCDKFGRSIFDKICRHHLFGAGKVISYNDSRESADQVRDIRTHPIKTSSEDPIRVLLPAYFTLFFSNVDMDMINNVSLRLT